MNSPGPWWLGLFAALVAGAVVAACILPARLRRYFQGRHPDPALLPPPSGPPAKGQATAAGRLLKWGVLLAAFAAGFIFADLGTSPRNDRLACFREMFHRLQWQRQGGRGESADWGEPFFYLCIFGVPTGLLFALVALLGLKLFAKFSRSGEK